MFCAIGGDPAKDSRGRQSLESGGAVKGARRHPEVSFAIMNDGRSMLHPKRSAAGREERIRLLASQFPGVLNALAGIGRFSEDAIDAYAMLWTARRLVKRDIRTRPDEPTLDRRGLRMEIVA
jgi:predicted RNase H-like nuclease